MSPTRTEAACLQDAMRPRFGQIEDVLIDYAVKLGALKGNVDLALLDLKHGDPAKAEARLREALAKADDQ